MASVTITQVQLQTEITAGVPSSQYWNTNTAIEMSINPDNIIGVGYVFDIYKQRYIAGLVQIYVFGIIMPIYSSNSYASIVAYMNPVTP